jgi:hypothetical protein
MLGTGVRNQFSSPLQDVSRLNSVQQSLLAGYFLDSAHCCPVAQFLANEDWTLKGVHMYILANLYPTSCQPLVMDAETVSEGMEFNSIVMQLVEEENCCI